ncbi:hypothetical protein LP420_37235 [Massilia sp. B-10]|nr:hypothetical protein LP420_37235 [Massilia sp. B-10]
MLALRMVLGLVWIRRAARTERSDAHWQARTSRMARRTRRAAAGGGCAWWKV